MSADWFCKIGEKKVGPLNNQQLKTCVAKGQLKPEHLVRRGDTGPWVPAGRIKGLFASGTTGEGKASPTAAKPLPKAAKSSDAPSAQADPLPAAAAAPQPPADIPQELTVGPGHKHHVQIDVDKFNIETMPVMVSRRKMKTGLQTLKKDEQKKATVILMSVICGGLGFGLLVLIWAFATGKFSSPTPEEPLAANSAKGPAAEKKEEKKPAEVKPAQPTWPTNWKQVSLETTVGDVVVTVLKPLRGTLPPGIKAGEHENEALIVRVNLQLKEGAKKKVPLTSWADERLKKAVFLKDDKSEGEGRGNTFALLGQVPGKPGEDTSAIGTVRIQVRLIFEMPAKIPKTMYLALPGAAFGADGTIIAYQFNKDDVNQEKPGASASSDKADAEHKEGAK